MPVADKKQKTQSFKSGFQQTPDSAHVPRPEKDPKKSGTKPSFQQKPDHSDSANASNPEERAQKTSGTNSSSQKRPDRYVGTQDSKPDKEPKRKSSKPSANRNDDYPHFPPGFGRKYSYDPSDQDTWTFEGLFREDFTKADTPHNTPPRSRAATPEQGKASEEKDDTNIPPSKQTPTPEHREEFEQHDDADVSSPPHAPPPQSLPRARHPLKSLINLAHAVGDPT
jgi:hypothetical protein